MPESADSAGPAAAPDTAPKFLAAITTEELQARGLLVMHSKRQGILAEISASSPAHPDRGSVSIGYDGFMVWERWAPAADSDRAAGIVRLIAWILMGDAVTAGPRGDRPGSLAGRVGPTAGVGCHCPQRRADL